MLYVEIQMSGIYLDKGRTVEQRRQNQLTMKMRESANNAALAGRIQRNIDKLKREAANREAAQRQPQPKLTNQARLASVKAGLTYYQDLQSQSGSPPGSARSTTSTTSLFSAPERNAELSSSPLSSARSNKSTSSTSSIFFAPGGKHRTRRHKKYAKRTRKH
jgi:hypothetical protein